MGYTAIGSIILDMIADILFCLWNLWARRAGRQERILFYFCSVSAVVGLTSYFHAPTPSSSQLWKWHSCHEWTDIIKIPWIFQSPKCCQDKLLLQKSTSWSHSFTEIFFSELNCNEIDAIWPDLISFFYYDHWFISSVSSFQCAYYYFAFNWVYTSIY